MNTPISCLIIEDNIQAATMASDIITKNFSEIEVISVIPDVKTALKYLRETSPDFILLDVSLKDGNAFSLLKEVEQPAFKIIFTTSYSNYAIDAFKFSALDYLLKPYKPEELVNAINSVVEELSNEHYHKQLESFFHNFDPDNTEKKLVLKNLETIHIVNITNILYIESDNNYSTFYLENGKELLVSKTLKSYETKLKDYHFFRVHQSFLVNLRYMESFDKKNDQIILLNNTRLPVSQGKKKLLLNYLNKLL